MIQISVDEAGAYDALSILAIKVRERNEEAAKSWVLLNCELIEQLGYKHFDVTASNEFDNLFDANDHVFNLINELKTISPNLPASIIDEANYRRFLCKQALQARFFPDSQLTEVKIGYDSSRKSLDSSTKSDTLTS